MKRLFYILLTISILSLLGCQTTQNKNIPNNYTEKPLLENKNENKNLTIKNEQEQENKNENLIYYIDFYNNDIPSTHYLYEIDIKNKSIKMENTHFTSAIDMETTITEKLIIVNNDDIFNNIVLAYEKDVMNSTWAPIYCCTLEDIEKIINEDILTTKEEQGIYWENLYMDYDKNNDGIITYKEDFDILMEKIINDLNNPNSENKNEFYYIEFNGYDDKPVIYLYPEEETKVKVSLDYNGEFTTTYPQYNNGWSMIAKPNGTLIDPLTNKEYYCLFWEGVSNIEYDLSKGFVIKGEDTRDFLEISLKELGLSEREINEFIIYWLPKMEHNQYNLITFQNEIYTNNAILNVSPTPNNMIRVFMVWKELEKPISIEPQELKTPQRDGFVVVEWGGREIK